MLTIGAIGTSFLCFVEKVKGCVQLLESVKRFCIVGIVGITENHVVVTPHVVAHCFQPMVINWLATRVGEDNPFMLSRFHSQCDGQLVFAHVPCTFWNKGVVGIVASRLVEAYYKPTVIFTKSTTDDLYTGSARSIKEFDVHAALEQCSDLLEHFGGHRCAAGVSVKPENLEAFKVRFEEVVKNSLPQESMVPEIEIDAELDFGRHITPKFLRILKQFGPFGPENNLPVFVSHSMVDTGYPRVVGSNHLKFNVISLLSRSRSYPAIGFQLGKHFPRVKKGEPFTICYTLEENYWNGRTDIQINVKDLRFDEE